MVNSSLLVHTINNNLENIDVLLSGSYIDDEEIALIGIIIFEQMNKILENATLYYLEDDSVAIHKKEVLLCEYINYIFRIIKSNIQKEDMHLIIKNKYNDKKLELDNSAINKIQKILNYMISTLDIDNNIFVEYNNDELEITFLKKIKKHCLQN